MSQCLSTKSLQLLRSFAFFLAALDMTWVFSWTFLLWSHLSRSEPLSVPSSGSHTRPIGLWDSRSKEESYLFASSRDAGSVSHTLHFYPLSGGKPDHLSPLVGPQDRAICLCLHTISSINLFLRLLNTPQLSDFLLQPSQLLKVIIKLGMLAPIMVLTYLHPLGDFQVPELPTAKCLDSNIAPQGFCLGACISPAVGSPSMFLPQPVYYAGWSPCCYLIECDPWLWRAARPARPPHTNCPCQAYLTHHALFTHPVHAAPHLLNFLGALYAQGVTLTLLAPPPPHQVAAATRRANCAWQQLSDRDSPLLLRRFLGSVRNASGLEPGVFQKKNLSILNK